MDLDDNKFQHLEALLDQTTMYSNFLAEQMEGIDEDDRRPKKKVKKAQEKVSEPASADGEVSETKKLLPMMNVEMRDYQLKGVRWLIALYRFLVAPATQGRPRTVPGPRPAVYAS